MERNARFELTVHSFLPTMETGSGHETHLCIPLRPVMSMVLRDIPKLMDEPTSGLDPVSREELLHIFRQIVKSEKCSILFSTHITSDLDRCTDDITYIQNGRVLQSADKDTFLRSFEHLKTPDDTGPLTLEEIMLRTERSEWDDDITV